MVFKINNTGIINSGIVLDDSRNLWANNIQGNEWNPGGSSTTGFAINNTSGIDVTGNGYFVTVTYNGNIWPPRNSNFGYASGGGAVSSVIDRFPFASGTTNATSVGNLTVARTAVSGQSSSFHGYTSGGEAPATSGVIDRWPFAASTTNATSVGNLSVARSRSGGQSSYTHGYVSGGFVLPATVSSLIDRFPFALATTNATSVANLDVIKQYVTGVSSGEYGYTVGGRGPAVTTWVSAIEKFEFSATTTDSVSIGNITAVRSRSSGSASSEYGYVSGGDIPPAGAATALIERWPFAAVTASSSSVGNLAVAATSGCGHSYTSSYGYNSASGGAIERWPYATGTTNATSVGNLSAARSGLAGTEF